MRYLVFGFLIAFIYAGNVIAGQQTDPYAVTPREQQQMAKNRETMVELALAPVWNRENHSWDERQWKFVFSENKYVVVKFQDLRYDGCAFVWLKKTGYVPVCEYKPIYNMLVSNKPEQIDEAITLIEIKAMQAGLIPYEQPDYPE